MSGQLPTSVTRASQVLYALLALGAVVALLTVVREDSLVRSWADDNASVKDLYRTGGLDAVRASSVHIPAFAPVAVVLYVVVAGLAWILGAFFRAGHGWARACLAVLLAFTAIGTAAALRTGPPLLFVVLAVAALLLEALLLVLLLHPDTSAYLRRSARADERDEASA
jgi:hypothetical protein